MAANLPALPPKNSTDWYAWAQALHAAASTAAQDGDIGTPGTTTGDALRAAFGRAAPVLASFVYDGSGNLTSYTEDGIAITLTYNADGTVATSTRGTDATQTYSYSGGNLVGVA